MRFALSLLPMTITMPLLAGIIGEENAHIVSNDPTTREAQIGETNGPVVFCGQHVGAMSLYKIDEVYYFIGAAHSFMNKDTLELKCDDPEVKVFLDYHYKGNPDFDPSWACKTQFKPVNHQTDFSKPVSLPLKTEPLNL